MSSTFRRRAAPDAAATGTSSTSTSSFGPTLQHKGTKAWTSGSVLVSTGLRELDNILAASTGNTGGQPLGSCIYLEQDRLSLLGDCFIRYWCAEGLSQEQELLIPIVPADCEKCCVPRDLTATSSWSAEEETPASSPDDSNVIKELLNSLPRNLHKDKQQLQAQTLTTPTAKLDTLEEEEEDEEGLVVAWQYRLEVQQERLGLSNTSRPAGSRSSCTTSSVYCHSFDLQGRLADQMDVHTASTVVPMGCCCGSCHCAKHDSTRHCGFEYYRKLVHQLQVIMQLDASSQPTSNQQAVVRVLLYHPVVATLAVALPLFLNYIRHHRLPVVVLVAVEPWTAFTTSSAAALKQIRRSSDVVLETESFVARNVYPPPPEFRHLHGLLSVRKAATCTLVSAAGHFANMTVQKRPAANLYGLKRDRRKLHATLLHIPPEDYAADGGSVGGGAVRSGAGKRPEKKATAGVGCSSSGGGNSPLDF